jgi:hypothetical protein
MSLYVGLRQEEYLLVGPGIESATVEPNPIRGLFVLYSPEPDQLWAYTTGQRTQVLRYPFFPENWPSTLRDWFRFPYWFGYCWLHLTALEVRVLVYPHLRASRFGIGYPALDETVHDLGLTTKKNLTPHLNNLVEKRWHFDVRFER